MDMIMIEQLAISLGLGLLVGLEREWLPTKKEAGIRTFALITLLGTVCAWLSRQFSGVLAVGLVAVAMTLFLGQYLRVRMGDARDYGITTEIAALVMFGVGALLVIAPLPLAVIIGGCVAVLLQWKRGLHGLVQRIGDNEIRAVSRLILIWLIILPVMPNRTFGPYDVLNPYQIWLMVVLIVGLSLGGYIAYRAFGARAGTLLAGLFGGLISSTATSVSYSRRSRMPEASTALIALVIMIASGIVFARVTFEIFIVAPEFLTKMAPPLLTLMLLILLISVVFWLYGGRGATKPLPMEKDPAQLKTAVIFGLLYALILFAVAAAREYLGRRGLYLVSAISGLTDADAITLSTAHMVKTGKVALDTGWRMILLGALCNVLFKGGIVAVLGSPRLFRKIAAGFGAAIIGGVLILLFWPPVI